jgi:hypothetical protein
LRPLWVILGLLAAAFVGSRLVGEHGRHRGLASGTEPVLVGFLLGPTLLGLLTPDLLALFTPLAQVGLGWLALIIGLDYRWGDQRSVSWVRRLGGSLAGLLSMAVVGGAAFLLLRRLEPAPVAWLEDVPTFVEAAGIGAACAETSRRAVRAVADRAGAKGRLTDLLADLADADDLAPMLVVGALFALIPPVGFRWPDHPGVLWAAQVGLGAMVGLMTAALLGREFRSHALWGVLFGTSMVAIGVAVHTEMSVLTVGFSMGLGLSLVSRHRQAIRKLVLRVETPLSLPALLLAGARIDIAAVPHLSWMLPTVLGARVVAKALVAGMTALLSPAARSAGPALVPGLLACGLSSLSIGLAFALRFPGPVGDTVLVCAAAATVLGELVAPPTLRTALRRAGEIGPTVEPVGRPELAT